MRNVTIWAGSLIIGAAAAAAAGCGDSGKGVDTSAPTSSAASGLPCEVARVLGDNCTSCHGDPLAPGSKVVLASRDNMLAHSPTEGISDKTEAQLTVERIADPESPMPPQGPLADEDRAILDAWIKSGMPSGECKVTIAPNPYATEPTCTTGTTWTRGDHRGSDDMTPGKACIECHIKDPEALRHSSLTVGGTLYRTAHEPNNCNGAGAATVVITGADGVELKLPASAVSGNFQSETALKLPAKVKVVSANGVRAMSRKLEKPEDGDCNLCHTENGTKDAPGRVMAP